MKWRILAIGKPALAFARMGIDEYIGRVRRYAPVELSHWKESGSEENARRLLAASTDCFRLVLDGRGDSLTSEKFAARLEDLEMDRTKNIAVLIGGAGGHTEEVRQSADLLLSLSSMTLQHELAQVVFLEQLYRAFTIRRGEPYHR